MSIETQITRLKEAKEAIKTSIVNKGVSVDDATKLDGYSSLIDNIKSGSTLWAGGGNPVLLGNVEKKYNLASDTDYSSITPSTSDQQILERFKLFDNIELDTLNYDYVIIEKILIDIKYLENIPDTYNYIKRKIYETIFNAGKFYYIGNTTKMNAVNYIFNRDATLYNNGKSGEIFATNYIPYGIKRSETIIPSLNSQSADKPYFNANSSKISIRASTNYMQIEAFNYIDTENSNITFTAELYQVDKGTAPYIVATNEMVDSINKGTI